MKCVFSYFFNRMRADDEKLEFVAYLHNEKINSGILMMN